MTAEEAIKRIQDHMDVHRIGEYPHIKLGEALNMAISALRDQEERRWIPVTERLPEKNGAFLVYVNARNKWGGYIKTIEFARCYEGFEDHMQGKQVWYDYDSECGDYEVRDVTHWMPLPEPPKGE